MSATEPTIRPAASLILTRHDGSGYRVLMGQRGAKAAFMPAKFVFPGGAVDPEDHEAPAVQPYQLGPICAQRLASWGENAHAFPLAALRELQEETGLQLRSSARLRYVFRAITPPGRSRRFDAHFFLADAADVLGDSDDFAAASDELSHLQWIGLCAARALDLPFITEVVLSEVTHLLAGGDQPGVPFFDNSGPQPRFRRLV